MCIAIGLIKWRPNFSDVRPWTPGDFTGGNLGNEAKVKTTLVYPSRFEHLFGAIFPLISHGPIEYLISKPPCQGVWYLGRYVYIHKSTYT